MIIKSGDSDKFFDFMYLEMIFRAAQANHLAKKSYDKVRVKFPESDGTFD